MEQILNKLDYIYVGRFQRSADDVLVVAIKYEITNSF